MGTGKVATKATKLAFASTVGAPVYLPRAARATTAKYAEVKERLGEATERVKGQGQEFAREYRQGLGAPVRGARRAWGGTRDLATDARMGVTLMTQRRGSAAPVPGPRPAATTRPRPPRDATGPPPSPPPRSGREAGNGTARRPAPGPRPTGTGGPRARRSDDPTRQQPRRRQQPPRAQPPKPGPTRRPPKPPSSPPKPRR